MLSFQVVSWAAIAPGLGSRDAWKQWLQNPVTINDPPGKIPLNSIPTMLRRRFNSLGKYAMGAALPLVEEITAIPSIFASRHGDTEMSFSLLESIGRDEPMSPTSFSLAVHNAVSGLFSIARKDISEVMSIAAMQGLVLNTIFEAIGQLQSVEEVLCVIYDIQLPIFYQHYFTGEAEYSPYAIAMILSNKNGEAYNLEQTVQVTQNDLSPSSLLDSDPLQLIKLLTGLSDEIRFSQNGSSWQISKVKIKC